MLWCAFPSAFVDRILAPQEYCLAVIDNAQPNSFSNSSGIVTEASDLSLTLALLAILETSTRGLLGKEEINTST